MADNSSHVADNSKFMLLSAKKSKLFRDVLLVGWFNISWCHSLEDRNSLILRKIPYATADLGGGWGLD